jgi:hypothetical protein
MKMATTEAHLRSPKSVRLLKIWLRQCPEVIDWLKVRAELNKKIERRDKKRAPKEQLKLFA